MDRERSSSESSASDAYDQIDSGIGNSAMSSASQRRAVSDSTQTEDFDTIDSRARSMGRVPGRNGHSTNGHNSESTGCSEDSNNGGLLSNLITMVLPNRRKVGTGEQNEAFSNGLAYPLARNIRCVSTQTEESPTYIRAHELCWKVIEELALGNTIPSPARDEVFEALCCCVCEILSKHEILFNGMIRRFEVTDYRVFSMIANELFEVSSSTSSFKITWGRVVSLFAYAVKLAQKYKEEHDEAKLENVVHYLSEYISRHLLDFVDADGGWEGLVKQFPLPDSEDKQLKRAVMWSGLCVGLVATMYVSSFLSK